MAAYAPPHRCAARGRPTAPGTRGVFPPFRWPTRASAPRAAASASALRHLGLSFGALAAIGPGRPRRRTGGPHHAPPNPLPSARENAHGRVTEVGAGGAGHGSAAADALVEVCAGGRPGDQSRLCAVGWRHDEEPQATCGPRRAFPDLAENACEADATRRTRVQSDASTCRGCGHRAPAQQPVACGDRHAAPSALRRTAQTCGDTIPGRVRPCGSRAVDQCVPASLRDASRRAR